MSTTSPLLAIHGLLLTAGSDQGDAQLVQLRDALEAGGDPNARLGEARLGEGQPTLLQALGEASIDHAGERGAQLVDTHKHLIQAAELLIEYGADIIAQLDQLLCHAHMDFIVPVINFITDLEAEGRALRDSKGQCALHQIVANLPELLTGNYKIRFHEDWALVRRSTDGATPLHVTWSLTEGGPSKMLAVEKMGDKDNYWHACEHHDDTIRMTRRLLEMGASLDDLDGQGLPVIEWVDRAFLGVVDRCRSIQVDTQWLDQAMAQHRLDRDTSKALGLRAPAPRL